MERISSLVGRRWYGVVCVDLRDEFGDRLFGCGGRGLAEPPGIEEQSFYRVNSLYRQWHTEPLFQYLYLLPVRISFFLFSW